MPHKYLFILSPPYSGSTALWQLLQSSAQVAALPDEGQKLPELAPMMRQQPWNPETQFDWQTISKVWHGYWDLTRPVLLEKSPPHLCRSEQLLTHFDPAYFILLLRDPVATCEALHRRNGMSYEEAAQRWIAWLQYHLACRETLPRYQLLYYEALTEDPTHCLQELADWMPELAGINPQLTVRAHSVHGVRERSLTNLNADKLARLTTAEREAVIKVLREQAPLLKQTSYASYLD